MFILEYCWKGLWHSGAMLVLLLPFLLSGLIMHFISRMICDRMGRIFGDKAYIYITAPGVAVHELSHAFFAFIFGHKIHKIQLFSPEEDGTLGYVISAYKVTSLYQQIGNFFSGTGPLWGGLFVIWLLSKLFLPESAYLMNLDDEMSSEVFANTVFTAAFWMRWQTWVWFYLFFTVASHMTLSPPDLKCTWRGFFYLIVFVVIFELLFCWWTGLHLLLIEYFMKFISFAFLQMSGIISISALIALILAVIAPKRKI